MNFLRPLLVVIAALFCCAAHASAQTVVVNKYFNSGTAAGDVVELLVVQPALDMRGMIVKDFSSSMANDGGGKFQFSTSNLWSNVPAGTLVVLRNNNTAADTDASDFTVDVGLQNTTYFAALGGTFDIATIDLVMIKVAGSDFNGVAGSIHALAGGTPGAQFTNTAPPKLIATGSSPGGNFVFANSSTQSLSDYNGTDATGATATGLTFGQGNNPNNTAFINSLRTAVAGEPTVPSSNIIFSAVGATTLTLSFTPGNGGSHLVVVRAVSPVDAQPVDGTGYTANPVFGSGQQVGTNNFVVSSGAATSVTVTNLQPNTTYHFAVFEYRGGGATADYLTTSPAIANQTTAVGYAVRGTVRRAASGAVLVGATIRLADDGNTSLVTTTDANGAYFFANVTAGGAYTVSGTLAGFVFAPANQELTDLAANTTIDFTLTPAVVISEFRFGGVDPDGSNGALTGSTNEFIELANTTGAPVDVSGWSLVTNSGTVLFTVGNSTTIPAGGHYLIAGTSYALPAPADATLAAGTDIPQAAGIALFTNPANFAANTQVDAVGFASVTDGTYVEGGGLNPAGGISSGSSGSEYSFVRRTTALNNRLVDTDVNRADFVLVATNGTNFDGAQATLGSPNAQNRSSATSLAFEQLNFTLNDTVAGNEASGFNSLRLRSRTRDKAAAGGVLVLRRTFTNTAAQQLNSLSFVVADIATSTGTTSEGRTRGADLRVLSSSNTSDGGGGAISIYGATLDQPPAQPLGGGLNSTLSVTSVSTTTPLAAGATITVEFRVQVAKAGAFRFTVTPLAIPGAPPSTSEHLVMGNPSNAVADANLPMNYLLEKPQYVMSYHRDRGISNWVSWHLDLSWRGGAPRQNDFRNDTSLPSGWYQVQGTDYQGSGFDRGHMTPSADRTRSIPDNSATFLMTNMIPQAPDNNQGPWEELESYCRTLLDSGNELYIISGSVGTKGTLAAGKIAIPVRTWKVIIVLPVGGGDDAGRVTNQTRTIAVDMPNEQGIRETPWRTYRTSVDAVEALTGFDFFSNVPVSIQSMIEARVDDQ